MPRSVSLAEPHPPHESADWIHGPHNGPYSQTTFNFTNDHSVFNPLFIMGSLWQLKGQHTFYFLSCQGSSLCASKFAASPGETFAVLAPTIKQMRMLPLRLYNFSQLFWETVRAAKTGQKIRHNAHDPRSDKENNKIEAIWRIFNC